MDHKKLADKSIRPFGIPTTLSPAVVTARDAALLGILPIGVYKGTAAFWDLNLAVNEPLVQAEAAHILGNIDGAVEGTGLATVTVVPAAAIGLVTTTTITVPAGQVWFINAVVGTCLADATGTVVYNWRCSLFPDAAGSALGAIYHSVGLATPLGPQNDEFTSIATVFNIGNKPTLLRLPAGATISAQLTNTLVIATGVVGTMQLYGYVGKVLVA